MAKVKKLDSKRRVVFPDVFKPGDVFVEESITEGSVVFKLILPENDIPIAKTKMDDGLLVLDMPLTLEQIEKAIREERDSR
jgi:hypothetical protein